LWQLDAITASAMMAVATSRLDAVLLVGIVIIATVIVNSSVRWINKQNFDDKKISSKGHKWSPMAPHRRY
jgi:hypothetical protein